ncbi:MAG: hypothetical protein WC304_02940 [Candidatus Gracilibacteria bacterium]|jgi:hypothetical protein
MLKQSKPSRAKKNTTKKRNSSGKFVVGDWAKRFVPALKKLSAE